MDVSFFLKFLNHPNKWLVQIQLSQQLRFIHSTKIITHFVSNKLRWVFLPSVIKTKRDREFEMIRSVREYCWNHFSTGQYNCFVLDWIHSDTLCYFLRYSLSTSATASKPALKSVVRYWPESRNSKHTVLYSRAKNKYALFLQIDIQAHFLNLMVQRKNVHR